MIKGVFFMVILMTVNCPTYLQAQWKNPVSMENKPGAIIRQDSCWCGTRLHMDDRKRDAVVSFLHYQLYDSMPGRYNKQLLAGDMVYPKSKEIHKIIGYVQNQGNRSFHLYEFKNDGEVVNVFLADSSGQALRDYLSKSDPEGIKGVFEFEKCDSAIPTKTIKADSSEIFGQYAYDFGAK